MSRAGAALRRPAPQAEAALQRRFFLAGIAVALTAGAGWGAFLLARIAAAGSFTALSVFEVNAHGQAQIYGWVGLFVMGFAYVAVPRLLGAPDGAAGALGGWKRALAATSLPLMLAGIALRAVAEPQAAGAGGGGAGLGSPAGLAAVAGAGLELLAVALFVAVMGATVARSRQRNATPVLYVASALAWFLAGAAFDLLHLARLVSAPGREALLHQVAGYQFALRTVQIHGLALTLILGMSLWVLPGLFGLPEPRSGRARRLWLPLQVAVAGQVVFFLAFMRTLELRWAGALWLADLGLAVVAALLVWNLGLLRPGAGVAPATGDAPPARRPARALAGPAPAGTGLRTESRDHLRFLRAGHVWLLVSLAMLVAAPLWGALTGQGFSHAWYGATRHAITVGFVTLTIAGVAGRAVAVLHGGGDRRSPASRIPGVWLPFLLINAGCALRVTTQAATDLYPAAFPAAGVSGVLEVAGLTLWGAHVAAALLRHRSPDGGRTTVEAGRRPGTPAGPSPPSGVVPAEPPAAMVVLETKSR
ncbi:MAG: hypothetical protein ACLF0P_11800 [Thermoanaerobaculia bacterium]